MDKRIEKICDYIKRHYQKKLLLEDLAGKVNLSPFYFQRLFKQEMNESPTTYINRVRLERAAHLLKAGAEISMAQMAEDCGFSSAAVFNRAFKQWFKMPPLAFKESPAHSIVMVLQKEKIDNATAEIVYLPDMYVYTVPTSVNNENMLMEVEKAIEFCKQNKIVTTGRKMCVITHNAFHYPDAKHNYHVGITVDINTALNNKNQLFFIPEGKYACFITDEPHRKTREVLMAFKLGWMDKSNYTWRELICYEELLPGNSMEGSSLLQRKIYVPVKRK
ncbi:MAG: AraC family transcriptional regulator [Sphingobacteriales bacterium]|nr:AraC family transcriptional regulator [Sphingobacteriales bacterium]